MPETLAGWLEYLETLHPKNIELGLERVVAVKARLGLQPSFPIITVGGTNGKGSTCAMLESILGAAGYCTGRYTSPHLLRYNERVRVAGVEADDPSLCEAFAAVDAGRGDIALTYFEFGTLAALWLFQRSQIDVAILEVGLGGRLDAVNAFDPDCAIVTSIDIDHTDYLGDTRDAIGFEKAGIFRPGKPAICGEPDPPSTLLDRAAASGADLRLIGKDYGYDSVEPTQWRYWEHSGRRVVLPHPALRGAYQLGNAAGALAALAALKARLPVTSDEIRRGLLEVCLTGRFQVLPGRPQIILDVAHNPHAAAALAATLRNLPPTGKTIAVFAMLHDKDMAGVVGHLRGCIDLWLVAGIAQPRGAGAAELAEVLEKAGEAAKVQTFTDVAAAFGQACAMAGDDDRIAAFGSFFTVAEVLGVLPARTSASS